MIKKLLILLTSVLLLAALSGCSSDSFNYDFFDTVFHYDTAILSLPDGSVVRGSVESWCDYEDGDQLQVCIDGTTYLVHSSDVVFISYSSDNTGDN